jgi:hypothetical protein
VRVDDALRVAGGAARVAHRRGPLLVVDPELHRLGLGQESLVVVDLLASRRLGHLAPAVVHDHDVAHGLELVEEGPHQPGEGLVHEHDLVLGVVRHVDELLGEQPDVERVQDPAGARRGEVELQVAGGVPAERGHPAVVADAQRVEHATEPAGALGPLAVGLAHLARRGDRDDLLVGEEPLSPHVQMRQGQRKVLHEPVHQVSPCVTAGGRPA